MDRLTALQVFHRVARGSFAEAGRSMGLSPAAISKNIAELEAHVGTRLIQRTTRRMALTEEGRLYLEHVTRALDALADADSALCPFKAAPSGLLKVSAPMTFTLTQISCGSPPSWSATPGYNWTCTWTTDASISCAKASIWPYAAVTGSRIPR
jgi:DNA-binding transcriptional LysR family regulator